MGAGFGFSCFSVPSSLGFFLWLFREDSFGYRPLRVSHIAKALRLDDVAWLVAGHRRFATRRQGSEEEIRAKCSPPNPEGQVLRRQIRKSSENPFANEALM